MMKFSWRSLWFSLYYALTTRCIYCITVYRTSTGNEYSVAPSIDSFTNTYGTDAFCRLRRASCVSCGPDSPCCYCQCANEENFYSEAVGCLEFSKFQKRVFNLIGTECKYGVNIFQREIAETIVPSFPKIRQAGFEIQGFDPGTLDISKSAVECKTNILRHIDVNGDVKTMSLTGNSSGFDVEPSAKRRRGHGFKLFNIKVLKYIKPDHEWHELAGKLLILHIKCSDLDSGMVDNSCFLFSVNGTDSMPSRSDTPASTLPPTTRELMTMSPVTTDKSNNGTGQDGSRTLAKDKSSYLIPIIAGVAVSVIVIILLAFGFFFMKKRRKYRRADKVKTEEEPIAAGDPKATHIPGDYDYCDSDKVRFKQKVKDKTATNPYYRSADLPPEVREAKNVLYEPQDEPAKSQSKEQGVYEPLANREEPEVYDECIPMQPTGEPAYVEYNAPDSPKYQPLGGRDDSPEYKGLYKIPKNHEPESADRAVSPEYETCGSPVYREVYPDWPLENTA